MITIAITFQLCFFPSSTQSSWHRLVFQASNYIRSSQGGHPFPCRCLSTPNVRNQCCKLKLNKRMKYYKIRIHSMHNIKCINYCNSYYICDTFCKQKGKSRKIKRERETKSQDSYCSWEALSAHGQVAEVLGSLHPGQLRGSDQSSGQ